MDRDDRDTRWSELMRLVQTGDKEAYRELLSEVFPVLHAFVSRRIRSSTDVDDILQEVLIGIHKARHTFVCKLSFLAWAYTIARYKIIDHRRRVGRMPEMEELSEHSIEGYHYQEGSTKELAHVMSTLPEQQRQVLKLVKLEGLSVREAAKITGASESSVKVMVHRALKRIKQHLFES